MQVYAIDFDRIDSAYATLPGHVKASLPTAKSVAKTDREYVLLIELCKSFKTRQLIGTKLSQHMDIEKEIRRMIKTDRDRSLVLRLKHALKRFEYRIIQFHVDAAISRKFTGKRLPSI